MAKQLRHYKMMGKKKSGILFFVIFCSGQLSAQQDDYNTAVNKYIQKYKDIAIREMHVYHVPASITLAQGILESNAGRSALAVGANNHFGIKCHKEWTGLTFYQDDDVKNECFRKYEDPFGSFRDHSFFLTQRERYKSLFSLDISDYKGWAIGLKSAGYATNPVYAQKLIKTIETFLLDRYDKAELTVVPANIADDLENPGKHPWLKRFIIIGRSGDNRNVFENNRLHLIIARQDDDLYTIARDCKVSVDKLLKYNDLTYATALKSGQVVYLEQKRRKGADHFHKVQVDEDLYSISQLYGIKLKMLYKRNDLQQGVEPKEGTILRLR